VSSRLTGQEGVVKRICTQCGRISSDGSLWCQDPSCPGGALSVILDYGDTLGDIAVTRLIGAFRNAAIYEARRGEEQVLLKVAHEGCQEQLKREAGVLAQLAGQHSMLPILLSPYPNTDIKQRPYGKTTFRDEAKYYELFEYVDGELLRDMLLKNPQPWYVHGAWLIISIADAVAFLHVKAKKLHLNINPDIIYTRLDRDGIPRPLLLDLGVVGDLQNVDMAWLNRYGLPAYTPPEVLGRGGTPTFASDVYGLGLVLYEMLSGHPAFPYKLQQDAETRQRVVSNPPLPMNRSDLADDVVAVVHQAIEKDPTRRQPDVRTFAKALRSKFGEVPVERKSSGIKRRMLIGVIAAVLVVVALVLVSAALG